MAQLGEFIGALLADAVQARVRADFESLKVAEAYSGHELLRHLPVPRFRLPDISVEFPALVTGMSNGAAGKPRLFHPPTQREITDLVKRSLDTAKVTLSDRQRTEIASAVQRRNLDLFKAGTAAMLRSYRAAEELARTAAEEVGSVLPDDEERASLVGAVDAAVRASVQQLLTQKITQSPHLQVAVTSSDIKAHGDTDGVLRLRLTITEDAFELVDRDGDGYSLVPE